MSAFRFLMLYLFVWIAAPSYAGSPDEREQIFQRFDHANHEHALKKAELSCVACHQIGGTLVNERSSEQLSTTFMTPPEGACHQCHAPGEGGLGAGEGMRAAPHRCETCHENVQKPDSHSVNWTEMHGSMAQEGMSTCLNCHTRSTCTDCHDRRQTAGQKVHDRAWLTVHGIAVQADPTACDACHVQSECISCHASGSGWGRNP